MRGKNCNPLGNNSILNSAKVLLPPPPLPHTHIPDQSPAQLEPDFEGSYYITGNEWGMKKRPKYEWSAGKQI